MEMFPMQNSKYRLLLPMPMRVIEELRRVTYSAPWGLGMQIMPNEQLQVERGVLWL
jgi:hypothetical protein